ncbi:response regulator [Neorhizobium alkalisoli]|uniref:Response regulator receiver domain-containing protein n=1 Tax=Neorhizobium alkalisoli TaxID=528178 RepID=A0A561QGS0_9HYPH|nr:response regulator [Neorhizobium alkalisoli]TWF49501.1 response regulator receiver domain-containing protein [Neorhizobium alkalisoli]
MKRILIVEDEMLVAMLIEDAVTDMGHEVVGPAMRLETALETVATETFDFAILDINLAGNLSFPVADRLVELGIPFVFASGYGSAGLAERYHNAPVVQKPFAPQQLEAVLQRLL